MGVSLVLGCIDIVVIAFIPVNENCGNSCWEKILQTALVAFGKFWAAICYGFLTLWQTEIYPSSVRAIGMGL